MSALTRRQALALAATAPVAAVLPAAAQSRCLGPIVVTLPLTPMDVVIRTVAAVTAATANQLGGPHVFRSDVEAEIRAELSRHLQQTTRPQEHRNLNHERLLPRHR